MVELRNLLSKHKVEELVPLVKESQVKAEDLEGLLAIARKGGSQSKVRSPVVFAQGLKITAPKVAKEMVVRYLNSACPTTRELAAFAASTSKELLPDEMLETIIKVHTLDLNMKSLHKTIVQGIHEVSREEVVEKEVVPQKALSFNKDIPEQDVVVKTDAEDEVEEEKVEGREILRRFLEFTKFPEKYRDPMIEEFFEEAT